MVPNEGFIKIHLQSAHLTHNTEAGHGLLHKMDPFVVIMVGKQQWRSAVCVNGGKNPHWQMQCMDIPVKKLRKL
jgi:hypothetical protein